ncbi:MAG: NADH-quinone oxidoreductase subunit G [Helicobacteraceae bacterium]|nr:NADH-quinone oxidoreductase subunit G [Helicobacteraceae bacterium]
MEVKINIDGQEIICEEGESILNAARSHGVFIPAICYLSCASPTLACKMCMVEADGKRVYACNAKVKNGMNVLVNTKEIEEERKAIMQAYNVNHPLQCGVCDKSGECELQNYTHFVGVAEQNYAIKDNYKEFKSWGKAVYDPNLCIVCERCVTLCKDKIGKSHIKALKFDGEMPDKAYKDSMPKDAFSVWTKFKKSLIGLNGVESSACGDCAECVSVCPVGALSIGHFQYRSNAWELEKIPSACPHCACGCEIVYEVKHKGISGGEREVYRVTSDWNFSTLCSAGRLAFNCNNQQIKKNVESLNKTIAAFKEAQSIRFSGDITNEDALILQRLKERCGYKLVCDEVKPFSDFIKAFSGIAGNYGSASLEAITKSDFAICFGGALSYDMPVVTHKINNAMKLNKGSNLAVLHTMEDLTLKGFSKNAISGIYRPNSEWAVALALAYLSVENPPAFLESKLKEFFKKTQKSIKKEVKEKNGEEEIVKEIETLVENVESPLFEYCGGNFEEAFLNLKNALKDSKNPVLIVGFDVYNTPFAREIAEILGAIEKYSPIGILLLPPTTNALGISLICELDSEVSGYCIGINTSGNYKIGRDLDSSLILPHLSECEGSLVNVDKRLVPLNPATPYGGYELNDIANALGLETEFSIDYTEILPISAGFKAVKFDDLGFGFANDGSELRGYLLDFHLSLKDGDISALEKIAIPQFNAYFRNSVSHFSPLTLKSPLLDSKNGLQVNQALADKLNLKDGDKVRVSADGVELELVVSIDSGVSGEFVAIGLEGAELFKESRYANISIKA